MSGAGRTALLLGGSGLVGGHVLRLLLERPDYARVVAVGRRRLPLENPKLLQVAAELDETPAELMAARPDDVFCCLGTTLAKAGSREAFRRVDLDAVVLLALSARSFKVRRFALVSSAGADARSPVFYSRVKGEAEDAVANCGFESCVIARPSLLLGPRAERRPMEALAQAALGPLRPLMVGPLRRYRPIPAELVARALVNEALRASPGVRRLESDQLEDAAAA